MRLMDLSARILALLLVSIPLIGCSDPDPLKGLIKGETGRVVKILDGDTVALNTGLVVRLVCVTAPNFKELHGKESTRLLEDIVQGREIELYYGGLTRDKFDRALAHVKTVDNLGAPYWINQSLIQQGAGWVDVYPDTADACAPLIADELAALEARQGLWRKRDYKAQKAQTCCEARGVKFITGVVENAQHNEATATCSLSLKGMTPAVEYAGMCLEIHQTAANEGAEVFVRGYFNTEILDARHPLNVRISKKPETLP